MNKLTKTITTIGLLALLIVSVEFLCPILGVGSRRVNNEVINEDLPRGVEKSISVDRNVLIVKERGKQIVRIPLQRGDETIINQDSEGNLELPVASWVPRLVCLPQLGFQLGSKLEPLAGLQVLRIDRLGGLGLSFNLSPSTLSLGIDKDILNNSSIKLLYGITTDGYTRISLGFSVYL